MQVLRAPKTSTIFVDMQATEFLQKLIILSAVKQCWALKISGQLLQGRGVSLFFLNFACVLSFS